MAQTSKSKNGGSKAPVVSPDNGETEAVKVTLSPAQKAAAAFAQKDALADLMIDSKLPEKLGTIRGRTSFQASQTVAGLSE